MTPIANLGAVKLVIQGKKKQTTSETQVVHHLISTIKRIADAQRANADTPVKARDRALLSRFLRHIARLCGR